MKITSKFLSIPPFISTSWDNILALHLENYDSEPLLVVILKNGMRVELPPIDPNIVEEIFSAHAKYLNNDTQARSKEPAISFGLAPFKMGAGLDQLGSALQHNPEQTDSPDMPSDILDKIVKITKAMEIDEPLLPKAEPHCNCMHCQIARAIRDEKKEESLAEEETVSVKDLTFRLWDVAQTTDKLYRVTNPLDSDENYNVFLGEPIGCTCGQKNCEHIKAVLSS